MSSHDTSLQIPGFAEVEAAARRIKGHAHRTPVLTSRTFDRLARASVFSNAKTFSAAEPSSSVAP